jgi:hypothetical protein
MGFPCTAPLLLQELLQLANKVAKKCGYDGAGSGRQPIEFTPRPAAAKGLPLPLARAAAGYISAGAIVCHWTVTTTGHVAQLLVTHAAQAFSSAAMIARTLPQPARTRLLRIALHSDL